MVKRVNVLSFYQRLKTTRNSGSIPDGIVLYRNINLSRRQKDDRPTMDGWLKRNTTVRYDCIWSAGMSVMNKIGKEHFMCKSISPSSKWVQAGCYGGAQWAYCVIYQLKSNYNEEKDKKMTESQLYQVMQDRWVKENNVKEGGTVLIAVKVPDNHLGWGNSCFGSMDRMLYKRYEITRIADASIVVNGYYFSFMSLADYKPKKQEVTLRYFSGGKDITDDLTAKSKTAIAKANS